MLIKRPESTSTTSDKSGLHMRAKSRMFSVSSRADSGEGYAGTKSGRQSVTFDQNGVNGHNGDYRYNGQSGNGKHGPISTSSGTATGRYSEHDDSMRADLTQATDDSTFPIEPEPKSEALRFNESHSTLQSMTDSLQKRAPGGKVDRLPRNAASQEEKDTRPRTSRTRRQSSQHGLSSASELQPPAGQYTKPYYGADSEYLGNYLIDGGGPSPVDSTYLEQQIADYDDGIVGALSEDSSGSSSRPPVPISSPVHYPTEKGYPQADTPLSAKAKIAASLSPRKRPSSAKSAKLRAHCSSRSGKCSCSVCITNNSKCPLRRFIHITQDNDMIQLNIRYS